MKAVANTTADFYYGPSSATPLVLKAGNVPVRVVADLVFVETDSPYIAIVQYMTVEDGIVGVDGPLWEELGPGEWKANWGYADRIAYPSASPIGWLASRVEAADRPIEGFVPYHRVHLVDPADFGGVDGGGGGGNVGAELYQLSPWGIALHRSGPMSWGDFPGSDTIMSTDGEGFWEILDVGDGIVYVAASWDGTGTKTFVREDLEQDTVDCIEQ